jgi:hypothetical protein
MPEQRMDVETFARGEREASRTRLKTDERTFRMSTTKRQTMSKMNRERELREKRELKRDRKEEKKLAAAAAAAIEAEASVAAPSG